MAHNSTDTDLPDAMAYRPRRLRTRFPVKLMTDDGEQKATLRDVSIDGARVEVEDPLLAGSAVSLTIGPASVPALVQWSRSGSVGLRFMDRPDPGVLTLIPRED